MISRVFGQFLTNFPLPVLCNIQKNVCLNSISGMRSLSNFSIHLRNKRETLVKICSLTLSTVPAASDRGVKILHRARQWERHWEIAVWHSKLEGEEGGVSGKRTLLISPQSFLPLFHLSPFYLFFSLVCQHQQHAGKHIYIFQRANGCVGAAYLFYAGGAGRIM